jgi:formylglycine-generating enzyme
MNYYQNTHTFTVEEKTMNLKTAIGFFAVLALTVSAQAVTVDLVPVGRPGNLPDTRYNSMSVGKVDYTFQMGKFEITAGQYCDFLNAVADTDTYGLYRALMSDLNHGGCNIVQDGSPGNYSYSVPNDWANLPVNYVSWGDAARFCNWLSNGQPTGAQGPSTTEDGSYFINGATSQSALMAITRKPNATWVIPSENEWYKAAYHKNDGATGNYWNYPTKSDLEPSRFVIDPDPGNSANYYSSGRTEVGEFENSESPYGTFDQGGNVWEWNEAVIPVSTELWRGMRGGSWNTTSGTAQTLLASYRSSVNPTLEGPSVGFRVAFVPEPGCITLLVCAVMAGLIYSRRFM